jgi:hypothetical protein
VATIEPPPVARTGRPAAAPLPDDVDQLVDEVQDSSPDLIEAAPAGAAASRGEPRIHAGVAAVDLAAADVELTDVAGDLALFDDPGLEVAHLVPGQVREIVVPVLVGTTGPGTRRYKLSVKLRLDNID